MVADDVKPMNFGMHTAWKRQRNVKCGVVLAQLHSIKEYIKRRIIKSCNLKTLPHQNNMQTVKHILALPTVGSAS